MIKNIIHRISAVLLLAVMLTSSMGFSVDMHYCGGEMKSYSLFGDAKSCYAKGDMVCYADNTDDSHEHQQCNVERKKCCENRMLVIHPLENQNIEVLSNAPEGDQDWNPVGFDHVSIRDAAFFENAFIAREYRPPLLLRTTPLLLQSFLI